jgi:hypothetical protein
MGGAISFKDSSFILDKLAQRIDEAVDSSTDFDSGLLKAPSATADHKSPVGPHSAVETKPELRSTKDIRHLPHAAQLPDVPGLPPVDPGASVATLRLRGEADKVEIRLRQLLCKLTEGP